MERASKGSGKRLLVLRASRKSLRDNSGRKLSAAGAKRRRRRRRRRLSASGRKRKSAEG